MPKLDKAYKSALRSLSEVEKDALILQAAKHSAVLRFQWAYSHLGLSTEQEIALEITSGAISRLEALGGYDGLGERGQLKRALSALDKDWKLLKASTKSPQLPLEMVLAALAFIDENHSRALTQSGNKVLRLGYAGLLRKACNVWKGLHEDLREDYAEDLAIHLARFHHACASLPMRHPLPMGLEDISIKGRDSEE